jgi:hypothetical protein
MGCGSDELGFTDLEKFSLLELRRQAVTITYERARDLRAVGEHDKGFTVTASKTVAVPVDLAVGGVRRRDPARALASGRPASHAHRAQAEVGSLRLGRREHPSQRLLYPRGEAKGTVALLHERLADAGEAERMKAFWRARVSALKQQLEGRTPENATNRRMR